MPLTAYNLSTDEELTFSHDDREKAFNYIAARYETLAEDPRFDNDTIFNTSIGSHMGDWSIPNANK